MKYRGFKLDKFQEEAIHAISQNHSVVVSAPTGAGKTLIAEFAVEKAIKEKRQVVYTSPIKALSNQKFRDFEALYPGKVGIITGDVTHNRDAPLVIMTTEIFRNCVFDSPEEIENVSTLIFDEVHYISDFERGTVWEETIIFAPHHIQIVALSATIPNLYDFSDWISHIRKTQVVTVEEHKRPVPLEHHLFHPRFGEINLKRLKKFGLPRKKKRYFFEDDGFEHNIIDYVVDSEKRLPCLVFSFNRVLCETLATKNSHRKLLTKDETEHITKRFDELCQRFNVDITTNEKASAMRKYAKGGVAYHHAGVLPSLKEVVEQLFTEGLIKLLFTTETFALGINMPAAAVIFTGLEKYDGISFDIMTCRDYLQMAGRSGRRGIDPIGHVYSNLNPFDARAYDVERLLKLKSEPIKSRFLLSYSTLINLVNKYGEKNAIKACNDSFAAWQRKGKQKKLIGYEAKQRIRLLNKLGHLNNDTVTAKGKLASKIFGYELQISECYFDGVFESLNPKQIAILICAIIFEPRRGKEYAQLPKQQIIPISKRVSQLIKYITKTQHRLGTPDIISRLSFQFSACIQAWCDGASFEDLRKLTSSDDGDIIRNMRMVVQQIRILRKAIREDKSTADKLMKAQLMLNRDVVNAEAQLLTNLGVATTDDNL